MKFLRGSLLVATAALLLTALAFAQNDAEQQFMSEAAQDGMAKIHMAYLALQNAQNEQVKLFAQQMLNDYGQAQNDLIFIANQEGVLLPRELDAKNRDTFDALSQLHGAAFDEAYMKAMLNSHQANVPRFKQEAAKVDNPAIVDWASRTLPTLQSDLQEAQKVAPVVSIHATPTSEEQSIRSAGQAQPQPAVAGPGQAQPQTSIAEPIPSNLAQPKKQAAKPKKPKPGIGLR